MNIALIGYGKMGKEVEGVAKERGIKVLKVFNAANNPGSMGLTGEALKGVDVCIDFSSPGVVVGNILALVSCGKNIVVGTTGWYDRLDEMKKVAKEKKVGLLYAPNLSLGVNIFAQVVMDAARLMERYADYDVSISEMHGRAKADCPSGLALSLGSSILQTVKRKTELATGALHGALKPHQLHVSAMRVGVGTGRHTVTFDSECDTIEVVHTARSKRASAVGAIVAAEWLKGKKGVYTMRDVIIQ
jgi:4-hydroxy-tetrahydrodipicolinate reductase